MRKLFAQVLLVLMVPSLALGDVTRYVNRACANNGDGTTSSCAASAGAIGAYTTCANAASDSLTDYPNLVTAGVGNLIIDFQGSTADAQCTWATIVTDATHLVRLQTSGGNRPILAPWPDTTQYRISCSNGTGCLQDNLSYMEVDGFQAINTATGSGGYSGFAADTTASLSLKATNSFFQAANCTGGGNCEAFKWYPNVANTRLTLVNNLAVSLGTSSNSAAFYLRGSGGNAGEEIIAYNNGAYGGVYGFRFDGNGTGDARYFKNNWSQGNTTGYFTSDAATTAVYTTNLTEDATSPNAGLRNLVITFTNEGTQDFTLAAGDTSAQGAGTDLSTDPDGKYSFSTDLQGQTRTAPWDIGPLEVATATPTPTPTPTPTATPTPTPAPAAACSNGQKGRLCRPGQL